jgi:hypothetical protein
MTAFCFGCFIGWFIGTPVSLGIALLFASRLKNY